MDANRDAIFAKVTERVEADLADKLADMMKPENEVLADAN
jgi:hypothetical protein